MTASEHVGKPAARSRNHLCMDRRRASVLTEKPRSDAGAEDQHDTDGNDADDRSLIDTTGDRSEAADHGSEVCDDLHSYLFPKSFLIVRVHRENTKTKARTAIMASNKSALTQNLLVKMEQ
jgi:hypothetical protein